MPRSMVNMQVNCIPPGTPRVAQVYLFPPQPPSPITPKTYTSKRTVTLERCSYITTRTPDPSGVGGYEMACGHCRRPREKDRGIEL